jgi:hypothetical protein
MELKGGLSVPPFSALLSITAHSILWFSYFFDRFIFFFFSLLHTDIYNKYKCVLSLCVFFYFFLQFSCLLGGFIYRDVVVMSGRKKERNQQTFIARITGFYLIFSLSRTHNRIASSWWKKILLLLLLLLSRALSLFLYTQPFHSKYYFRLLLCASLF